MTIRSLSIAPLDNVHHPSNTHERRHRYPSKVPKLPLRQQFPQLLLNFFFLLCTFLQLFPNLFDSIIDSEDEVDLVRRNGDECAKQDRPILPFLRFDWIG